MTPNLEKDLCCFQKAILTILNISGNLSFFRFKTYCRQLMKIKLIQSIYSEKSGKIFVV